MESSSSSEESLNMINVLLGYYSRDAQDDEDIEKHEFLQAAEKGNLDRIKFLFEKNNAILHVRDNDNKTPLIRAAEFGNLEVLQYLFEHGADVNEKSFYDRTALIYAIANEHLEVVKFLIENGATMDYVDVNSDSTLLTLASKIKNTAILKYLLESESGRGHINERDSENCTLLTYPIINGDLETVIYLIKEKGIDLQQKMLETNATPIIVAAMHRKVEVLKYLLDLDLNIDEKDDDGKTALIYAIENDHLKTVKCLIEHKADMNGTNREGRTPLEIAASSGFFDIVKYLVEKGADVNIKDHHLMSPLLTSINHKHYEVAKFLIDNGANINDKNCMDITPLHLLTRHGNLELVKYLLEQGVDVDVKDSENLETPLMIAASLGYMDIVQLLVERRAYLNHKRKDGLTAAMIALHKGNNEIGYYLFKTASNAYDKKENRGMSSPLIFEIIKGNIDRVKELIEIEHADVNERSDNYITPLITAASKGNMPLVSYLLEKGANLTFKTYKGQTALHYSAKNGHLNVVKYLLEKDININEKNNKGDTALMLAAHKGHLQIAKALIDHGASVNDKDDGGMTPLLFAAENGSIEIIRYMLDHGANVNETDNTGRSALSIATRSSNKELIDFLKKNGARRLSLMENMKVYIKNKKNNRISAEI